MVDVLQWRTKNYLSPLHTFPVFSQVQIPQLWSPVYFQATRGSVPFFPSASTAKVHVMLGVARHEEAFQKVSSGTGSNKYKRLPGQHLPLPPPHHSELIIKGLEAGVE